MTLAELRDLYPSEEIGNAFFASLKISPKNIPQPVVALKDRILLIGPKLQEDFTIAIGTHSFTREDILLAASFASLLHWPQRLEFYIYTAAETFGTETTICLADLTALTHTSDIFSTNQLSSIEEHFTTLTQHPEELNGTCPDIFGISNNMYVDEKITNFVTNGGITTEQTLSVIRQSASYSYGHGKSNTTEIFTVDLITPYNPSWVLELERLGRGFSSIAKQHSSTYSLNPPDFSLVNHDILMYDWRIEPDERTIPEVLFAVDTSGSISSFELNLFLNQIYSIFAKYKVLGDIIFMSDGINNIMKISDLAKYNNILIHDRGGTQFKELVDYLEQYKNRFGAIAILSDGVVPDLQLLNKKFLPIQVFYYTKRRPELDTWTLIKIP